MFNKKLVAWPSEINLAVGVRTGEFFDNLFGRCVCLGGRDSLNGHVCLGMWEPNLCAIYVPNIVYTKLFGTASLVCGRLLNPWNHRCYYPSSCYFTMFEDDVFVDCNVLLSSIAKTMLCFSTNCSNTDWKTIP